MSWHALPYLFLIAAGLCLMGYSVIRFRIYLRETDNPIAFHLPMAMALSGLGIFLFGVYTFYPAPGAVYMRYFAGPFLELLGFAHFIAIPAYIFFKKPGYILTKGFVYALAFLLTIPPTLIQPVIGGFSYVALGIAIMEEAALLSNTLLLIRNYRSKKLTFHTTALTVAYLFAAPSGTYYYFGTNSLLLDLSGVGLLGGVAILLLSALAQLKKEPTVQAGVPPIATQSQ